MIPFSFVYYRPETLREAAETYAAVKAQGQQPMYYAGGSETITLCRTGSIQPDAVIDLKAIPACYGMALDSQGLHIGANCTLSQISLSGLFPLLGLACGRIADHSNQCRITLGGNLLGTILYRETALPLLLCDADITLYNPKGERRLPFADLFDGRLRLTPGEILVQVHFPAWALSARHFHVKKTANEKIDYPLVSLAALQKDGFLRAALSGVCSFPFRSPDMEALLNDTKLPIAEKAKRAAALLPEPAATTVEGSGAYRAFVLTHTLEALLREVEHDQV